MNILHISPNFDYSCGVSKHVFYILKYYSNNPNINIKFITSGGDALAKVYDIGVEPYIMNFKQGLTNVLFFPSNLSELYKFCIQNNIDIIHTHHRYPEFLATLISRSLNTKTITTVHSLVKGYKYLSFKSDKIITVSNAVKKSIIKNFVVPTEKMETLYNCIYPWGEQNTNTLLKLREKLNVDPNDFVILFLGRLNRFKGIDILIKSFRKVRSTNSKIILLLVGNIEDKTLRNLEVKQDEKIYFIEAQEDVILYYELCNLVVLSSQVESFPYVMLEAGIAYKPFIGSRTGGIAEFLEDGVNGYLFEPGNVDDLADKIKLVLNNPEKVKSATANLNKKVKKLCNCEEYFAKLTNIYNELLNE